MPPVQTSYPLLLTRISKVHITHAHTVCMHSYTPTQITNFLNRQDVQQDLGVKRTWEPCKRGIELLVHTLYLGSVIYSFTGWIMPGSYKPLRRRSNIQLPILCVDVDMWTAPPDSNCKLRICSWLHDVMKSQQLSWLCSCAFTSFASEQHATLKLWKWKSASHTSNLRPREKAKMSSKA